MNWGDLTTKLRKALGNDDIDLNIEEPVNFITINPAYIIIKRSCSKMPGAKLPIEDLINGDGSTFRFFWTSQTVLSMFSEKFRAELAIALIELTIDLRNRIEEGEVSKQTGIKYEKLICNLHHTSEALRSGVSEQIVEC